MSCFFPEIRPGAGYKSKGKEELRPFVAQWQTFLNEELGLTGEGRLAEDGFFGPNMTDKVETAWAYIGHRRRQVATRELWEALADAPLPPEPEVPTMVWGAMVSRPFRRRVASMVETFGGLDADGLMGCMAFETGRTFDPGITNGDRVIWKDPSDFTKGYEIRRRVGSTGSGLIQFMEATAERMGYSIKEVRAMSAMEQLELVDEYFGWMKPRISDFRDCYCGIFWPAGVGKSLDYVFEMSARQVLANKGLDVNRDGQITKREATGHIADIIEEGEAYRA